MKQKLVFPNCVDEDAETTVQESKGKAKQKTTVGIICGKLIYKYRMGRNLGRHLSVYRKQLLKVRLGKTVRKQRLTADRAS